VTGSDYRGLMKRIVIAGGIGAGKSAVGKRLRTWDFPSWTPTTSPTTSPSPAARHSRRWWTRSAVPSWTPRAPGSRLRRRRGVSRRLGAASSERDHARADRCGDRRRLDGADGEAVFAAIPSSPRARAVFSLDAVWSVQVSPETACDDSSTDADSVKPTRGPFGHADEQ